MLNIKVNDTITLTKDDGYVVDTVSKIVIANDVDGNPAVVGVSVIALDTYIALVPTSTYEQKYSKFWTVAEINGLEPEYTLAEQANA